MLGCCSANCLLLPWKMSILAVIPQFFWGNTCYENGSWCDFTKNSKFWSPESLMAILGPRYVLQMRNDQMSYFKAGNTWKAFQNRTIAYSVTQLWHNKERCIKANIVGLICRDIFYQHTSQKSISIHSWNFTQLIETPNTVSCESLVLIKQIATELSY